MENFEKTSEPKIVVCLICTSKLAKSSIKSHLKTKKHLNAVSKKSDRPFKCEKCLKSFRCKDNLNLHALIHIENTGNGNQICKICRKKFSTIDKLCIHMEEFHKDALKYQNSLQPKRS